MSRPYSGCMPKMALGVAMLALLISAAFSQPAPDRVYVLTFTAADIQVLGNALNERPFREVAPLINKLQQQIQAQEAKPVPPATPAPAAPKAVPPASTD